VFVVVALLTVVFLGLYGLGTWQAYKSVQTGELDRSVGVDVKIVAGAILLGAVDVRDVSSARSSPSSSRSARCGRRARPAAAARRRAPADARHVPRRRFLAAVAGAPCT
jgi:hypothetical protein